MKNLVILISGRGSNMDAIVRACRDDAWDASVRAVIASRADAGGLARARELGLHAEAIEHRDYPSRESFDEALAERVASFAPDWVILAGFMRVLSSRFLDRFAGRVVNIHPSLLPAFPGLATHRRALEAGVKVHGATVHLVTPELDHGPIVAQAVVPVRAGDGEATLAARVLRAEHRLYPAALRWLVEGRARVEGLRVEIEGAPADAQSLMPESMADEGVQAPQARQPSEPLAAPVARLPVPGVPA